MMRDTLFVLPADVDLDHTAKSGGGSKQTLEIFVEESKPPVQSLRKSYNREQLQLLLDKYESVRQTASHKLILSARIAYAMSLTEGNLSVGTSTEQQLLSMCVRRLGADRIAKTNYLHSLHTKYDTESMKNHQREMTLQSYRETMASDRDRFIERRAAFYHSREVLVKSDARLILRRKSLLSNLALWVYPIEIPCAPSGSLSTICGVPLPTSDKLPVSTDDIANAVALGYACHTMLVVFALLDVCPRFPLVHKGSRSLILDPATVPPLTKGDSAGGAAVMSYPLYGKAREKQEFGYAVWLLNKDIEQLRRYCGFPHSIPLHYTLANLRNLLHTLVEGFGVKSRRTSSRSSVTSLSSASLPDSRSVGSRSKHTNVVLAPDDSGFTSSLSATAGHTSKSVCDVGATYSSSDDTPDVSIQSSEDDTMTPVAQQLPDASSDGSAVISSQPDMVAENRVPITDSDISSCEESGGYKPSQDESPQPVAVTGPESLSENSRYDSHDMLKLNGSVSSTCEWAPKHSALSGASAGGGDGEAVPKTDVNFQEETPGSKTSNVKPSIVRKPPPPPVIRATKPKKPVKPFPVSHSRNRAGSTTCSVTDGAPDHNQLSSTGVDSFSQSQLRLTSTSSEDSSTVAGSFSTPINSGALAADITLQQTLRDALPKSRSNSITSSDQVQPLFTQVAAREISLQNSEHRATDKLSSLCTSDSDGSDVEFDGIVSSVAMHRPATSKHQNPLASRPRVANRRQRAPPITAPKPRIAPAATKSPATAEASNVNCDPRDQSVSVLGVP